MTTLSHNLHSQKLFLILLMLKNNYRYIANKYENMYFSIYLSRN